MSDSRTQLGALANSSLCRPIIVRMQHVFAVSLTLSILGLLLLDPWTLYLPISKLSQELDGLYVAKNYSFALEKLQNA